MKTRKKKPLREKISRINKLANEIDEKIMYHDRMHKFFVKLSLDYKYAHERGEYIPFEIASVFTDKNIQNKFIKNEVENIYKFSQVHLQKVVYFVFWKNKLINITRKNNLMFLTNISKYKEDF